MTGTKRTTTAPDTVTVTVTPGTLVFHDGEQRAGTITGVPTATAAEWARHGWATTQ